MTLATVSDAEDAAGSLAIVATSVPAGITVGSLTNANGTIAASMSAGCAAPAGAHAVTLQVTDRRGQTSSANLTLNVSAYSFVAVTRRARAMMPNGGSVLTLSYYGAEKVVPHYNVMGVAKAALETSVKYLAMDLGPEKIRVNAISAGPIKTLAASGIGDFRYIPSGTNITARCAAM